MWNHIPTYGTQCVCVKFILWDTGHVYWGVSFIFYLKNMYLTTLGVEKYSRQIKDIHDNL